MSLTTDPITLSSADLADDLSSALVSPADPGYDDARRAWNLSIDQRPSAVVHPTSVQDVIAAVLVARRRGQRIAAQGTGHGAWPLGAMHDTILLRTDRMRAVHVDPVARIARIEPGAVWGDVVAGGATRWAAV